MGATLKFAFEGVVERACSTDLRRHALGARSGAPSGRLFVALGFLGLQGLLKESKAAKMARVMSYQQVKCAAPGRCGDRRGRPIRAPTGRT